MTDAFAAMQNTILCKLDLLVPPELSDSALANIATHMTDKGPDSPASSGGTGPFTAICGGRGPYNTDCDILQKAMNLCLGDEFMFNEPSPNTDSDMPVLNVAHSRRSIFSPPSYPGNMSTTLYRYCL